MIKKPFIDVDAADINVLAEQQTPEGRTLEYKRELKLDLHSDKIELVRDVSSFLNTSGGDLLFGVEEARDENKKNLGYPERILGVPCPNFEQTKQLLESIIRDNLDPRPPHIDIKAIGGFSQGPVILLRIPRSWSAPHMVRSRSPFYARNNGGKVALDTHQIRNAFITGAESASRLRLFRDDRLARIQNHETPLALWPSQPVLVVTHLIPHSFESERVDVSQFDGLAFLAPEWRHGTGARFNIDGFVSFPATNGEVTSYNQAFRNGAFESLSSFPSMNGLVFGFAVEESASVATALFLSWLDRLGVSAPVSVFVSILGGKDYKLFYGGSARVHFASALSGIDRDPLLLHDALIEQPRPVDVHDVLKPVFDALAQAGGFRNSPGYDQEGRWRPDVHKDL